MKPVPSCIDLVFAAELANAALKHALDSPRLGQAIFVKIAPQHFVSASLERIDKKYCNKSVYQDNHELVSDDSSS